MRRDDEPPGRGAHGLLFGGKAAQAAGVQHHCAAGAFQQKLHFPRGGFIGFTPAARQAYGGGFGHGGERAFIRQRQERGLQNARGNALDDGFSRGQRNDARAGAQCAQHGKGGGAAVGRAAADSQHTAVRALVAFRGTRRQSGEHHFIRDDSRHKNTSFFTAAEPGVRDHRTARCTRAAGGACGPRRGRQLFLVNTGGAQSVSLKIWYTGIADFAIIVSQNPLLRRTGPKIFARAAVRDKAGFPLLKNAADAPTHRDSAAAAGSMVFRC